MPHFPAGSGIPRIARRLFAGFGLLLILAGGYGLWWHYLSETLRDDLDHWVAEQAAAGWKISTGTVAVSGFPLHVVFSLSAPGAVDPSGNFWQGPPLAVAIPLLDPRRPHLEAPGLHVLAIKGHDSVSISADGAAADLVIDDHGFHEVTLALVTASAGSLHVGRLEIQLRRLAVGKVDHTVPSWGLQVSLDNLGLPEDPRLLFGSSISAVRLETHLAGSLSGGPVKQSLAVWRDDGGTLEIDTLSIEWPPLALSGKGTLALDRDLQPILASSCNVRGLLKAIDALTSSGVVRPQDAGFAKLAFGLLMKTDKDGTQSLSVPLTVQNRQLSVGPAKLLELPALVWP
jgi:hypothetical protein